MNLFWSVFLGILQGLTEFLPISSSGHLVIAQSLIPGFNQPGVLFDTVLHLATLFAIVYFFRKRIFALSRKYYFLLMLGSIPAALIGFLFQKNFEQSFSNVHRVGIELIITGILNLMIDKVKTRKKTISYKDSFLVGISQAIAIIPGISRSGATIFTGIKLGIDRKKAAEFSFLLSIPAILGANILQLISHGSDASLNIPLYFFGFIAAFFSGFLSINVVLKTLSERRFRVFGIYCLLLGSFAVFI